MPSKKEVRFNDIPEIEFEDLFQRAVSKYAILLTRLKPESSEKTSLEYIVKSWRNAELGKKLEEKLKEIGYPSAKVVIGGKEITTELLNDFLDKKIELPTEVKKEKKVELQELVDESIRKLEELSFESPKAVVINQWRNILEDPVSLEDRLTRYGRGNHQIVIGGQEITRELLDRFFLKLSGDLSSQRAEHPNTTIRGAGVTGRFQAGGAGR